MITLQFADKPPRGVSQAGLRTAARYVQKATGFKLRGSITVAFVSRPRSRKLNRQFSGHDYATDVLSFAYEPDSTPTTPAPPILGDIAICTSIAKKQARQHKISLLAEVNLLLVHGLLHVLGFDHDQPLTQASFENTQNAIMKELKLPARQFFHGDVQ